MFVGRFMLRVVVSFFLSAVLLSTIAAAAQAKKPPLRVLPKKFLLTSVKATGSQLYSEQQIVAASGLKLNSQITQQDLQNASNLLGASGAFSNVTYRYTPNTANQVTAEFHVVDSGDWLPVIFENLVWFSRQELLEQLRTHSPLFKGNLPQAGELNEQVRAALEQMLAGKNVQAKVVAELHAGLGKPVDAILFRAEGVKVTISAVDWKNAQKLDTAVLNAVAKPLVSTEYKQTYVHGFLNDNIKRAYLARGFLKAKLAEHQTEVTAGTPAETQVTIHVPIEEGPTYKFKGVKWSGNTLLPSAELNKLVQLKPGDVANPILLEQQISELRKYYGRHGYMAVQWKVEALLAADDTAEFEIEMAEGDVYKMGNLEIRGLGPQDTQKLLAAWKLPKGATYDDLYPDQFGLNVLQALPKGRWEYSKQEKMNDQAKTVDLIIEFKPSR